MAETAREHWFVSSDAATAKLLNANGGPVAAALTEVPLGDGRSVWYLGPRWIVAHPCP